MTVEERWTPPASGGMIGVGRALSGDAVHAEITPTSATFENPAHDFPKLIRYTKLPDGTPQTAISAGGTSKPTTFVLKREQ